MIAHKEIESLLCPCKVPFNDEIPWSSTDDQLYRNFQKLHDILSEHNKRSSELVQSYFRLDKHIEEVRMLLAPITEAIQKAMIVAEAVLPGYLMKLSSPAQHFNTIFNETVEQIKEFDIELRILCAAQEKLNPQFNAFIQTVINGEDGHDVLWEEESEDKAKLCNEKGHSIDCVGFDYLDERFRNSYSFHKHRWRDTMHTGKEIGHNYDLLVVEVNLQYKLWEEFAKRCALIAQITQEYEEAQEKTNLN